MPFEQFDRSKLRMRPLSERLFVSSEVMTPTYTKPVFLQKNGIEETNRLDHKNTQPTPEALEQKIIDSIWKIAPEVDAIIALDQLCSEGYGALTPRVRPVFVTCGSGIVAALCAGAVPFEAAFVGNLISAITIQVIGTTGTATRSQILALHEKYYGRS
jgi:hypothetical protein